MNADLQQMDMASLVDLLSQETKKFTQLLAGKEFEKVYLESKEYIKQIQAAIEIRKETTKTDTHIAFKEPASLSPNPPLQPENQLPDLLP
jgi:hypothetical protein